MLLLLNANVMEVMNTNHHLLVHSPVPNALLELQLIEQTQLNVFAQQGRD
jgi:predicted Zn-dependent protease